MARHFDDEKFEKWENETHIPEDVMKMVEIVTNQLGIYVEETTVTYRNRGGYPYAYAKGFIVSYRTSSYADGPDDNYGEIFMKWIGGLGFEVAESYGDNGLDSTTNWHDTWWNYEIAYRDTMVYDELFYWWDDEEDDEDEGYYYDEDEWSY